MTKRSALELLDNLIAELEISIGKEDIKPQPPVNTGKEKGSNENVSAKPDTSCNKGAEVAKPSAESDELTVNSIDLRVGIIRNVKKHETAEKLYCEEIDIGEEAPRQIASGLVPYYSLEQMQNRRLIVICNLKPRNLVGFKSNGMVLCASKTLPDGSSQVEFVDPPANAKPGDRIVGEGLTVVDPLTATQCDKKKAFEIIAADLKVDENGIANWKGHRLVTLKGEELLTAPTLRDAPLR